MNSSPFPHTGSLLQPKSNAPKSMNQSQPPATRYCSSHQELLTALSRAPGCSSSCFRTQLPIPFGVSWKAVSACRQSFLCCRCCSSSEEEVAGGAPLSAQMFLGKTCGAARTILILEVSSTLHWVASGHPHIHLLW